MGDGVRVKTWVTEAAIATTAAGVLETVQQTMTQSPIIPEPWGALLVSFLGFVTLGLRIFAKKAGGA